MSFIKKLLNKDGSKSPSLKSSSPSLKSSSPSLKSSSPSLKASSPSLKSSSPSLKSSSPALKSNKSAEVEDDQTVMEKFDHLNLNDEEINESQPEDKKKLWSKIGGLIGKDTMSLVSLPVYFFEPLTVLESQLEPLRFVHLIEKACEAPDSLDRMCYITAFNIAVFSSYVRTAKPFNPLLGETFEYIPKNGNYKCVCEQVSHHPPIGVAETHSRKFNLQQECRITTKFWGNSVDVFSMGNNHLYLTDSEDYYTWKVPTSCCHNIIFGKMWIEHHGILSIQNHGKGGEKATINFHKSGWFDGSTRKITGEIFDASGKKRCIVKGNWNEYVDIIKLDDSGKHKDVWNIWRAEVDPEEKTNKWKLGKFLQSLNEMSEDYESILPPTDSRLRNDRRQLQNGNNKLASKEKNRIEEVQRTLRKQRETSGKKYEPKYFKRVDDPIVGTRWLYTGGYWEEREKKIEEFRKKRAGSTSDISLTASTLSVLSGEVESDVSAISSNNSDSNNIFNNNNNNVLTTSKQVEVIATTNPLNKSTTYQTVADNNIIYKTVLTNDGTILHESGQSTN